MGVLLIRCPHTGRDLTTGIRIDPQTFSRIPQVSAQTRCPHCRSVHFWFPREAKFVDSISHHDWIENQHSETSRDTTLSATLRLPSQLAPIIIPTMKGAVTIPIPRHRRLSTDQVKEDRPTAFQVTSKPNGHSDRSTHNFRHITIGRFTRGQRSK